MVDSEVIRWKNVTLGEMKVLLPVCWTWKSSYNQQFHLTGIQAYHSVIWFHDIFLKKPLPGYATVFHLLDDRNLANPKDPDIYASCKLLKMENYLCFFMDNFFIMVSHTSHPYKLCIFRTWTMGNHQVNGMPSMHTVRMLSTVRGKGDREQYVVNCKELRRVCCPVHSYK